MRSLVCLDTCYVTPHSVLGEGGGKVVLTNNFCKTSRETKIAWEGPNNDEDDVDGDSGFDKSEDLSKEILNEVSFYHF